MVSEIFLRAMKLFNNRHNYTLTNVNKDIILILSVVAVEVWSKSFALGRHSGFTDAGDAAPVGAFYLPLFADFSFVLAPRHLCYGNACSSARRPPPPSLSSMYSIIYWSLSCLDRPPERSQHRAVHLIFFPFICSSPLFAVTGRSISVKRHKKTPGSPGPSYS